MDESTTIGMHPGLETPKYFPGFHAGLIVEIMYALNPVLPETYQITVEGGVTVVDEMGDIQRYVPDAHIELINSDVVTSSGEANILVPEFTIRNPVGAQRSLAIRAGADQLVTTIEVLSPANKRGEGYDAFRAKQRTLAQQGINLVEIDLLQHGNRRWDDERARMAPYLFTVQRGISSPIAVWSARPNEALPTLPIPLRYPDADVPLALEELVTGYLKKSGVWRRLG
jgi:hypothetical protein